MKACLVGLGNHGQNRLLPSIKNSNLQLVAIVSKKKIEINFKVKFFINLDDAINHLDKNIIFILATPPNIHEVQILKLISNGFSVIAEKPCFITMKNFKEFSKINFNQYQFLYENFMYKENKSFRNFNKVFKENFFHIDRLEFNFLIPSFPKNTFRKNLSMTNNIIYDIGCYPISLINHLFSKYDLSFSLKPIKKNNIYCFKSYIPNLKINLNIRIGISQKYQNNVILKLKENRLYEFDYFFYGRKKIKSIKYSENKKLLETINYTDQNSFTKIFNKNKTYFIKNNTPKDMLKKNLITLKNLKKLI